ncbi:YybS family protein [Amphibacillus cookii]|uniref:YybS family protein n=1 Tax=Amphibacillus cookii TaxID=767787 RepID=UPI0019560377|nr:YybS family protein [Amphibacillus cookii]MBM7541328.1 uncharacterized protein YybS (DUF2232 family) [Amphibacillus cookii]
MHEEMLNKIKEGFLVGAIFVAFLLMTLVIPAIELMTLFILPIPIAFFAYRQGWKAATWLGVIIGLTLFLFAIYMFIVSLPLTLLAVLTGTLIGQSIKAKRHPYETWVQGTLGFIVGFIVLLFVVEWLSDVSLATEYQLFVSESLTSTQVLFEQWGMALSGDDLQLVEEQMLMVLDLIPSIIVVTSMILAVITQFLTYKVLNKSIGKALAFPPFRRFNLPRLALWLYFVIMMMTWFELEQASSLQALIGNASVVIGVLFSLQGFSFVFHYMHAKKQPKFVAVLITIFSLIIFPVGLYLTRILGIIDVGFMMKKRLK